MTEDPDSVSSHRTWRFAGLYADQTASGFACGMRACDRSESRRSIAPQRETKDADRQGVFYVSDGTRTRDLRRDRPVLALAG
jgi:hypothetical protein